MTDQRSSVDILDELTTDHRDALELLEWVVTTSDRHERRELADTAITELVRHSVSEETYLYPTMRDHLPEGADAVSHGIRIQRELEAIMKQLEGVPASDPRFDVLVHQLTESLRDHAHAQETQQFPLLRKHVGGTELVELRHKVDHMKKLAPTRPHPHTPHSAGFHKLVDPGLGLVDRVRGTLAGLTDIDEAGWSAGTDTREGTSTPRE